MAYPLSIQLYTIRQYQDDGVERNFLKLAEAGYQAVETGGRIPDPADYLQKAKDCGLTVSSYFGAVPTAENVQEIIETAQGLKVQHVVCGFWIPDFESDAAIQKTAEALAPYVDKFKKSGLILCLHNHWFEFEKVGDRLAVAKLLDLCPGLNLELDIYWANHFGDNDLVELVQTYRSIIPLLHVKDGPLVKGEPHTALGKGKVQLMEAIEAADPNVLKWLVVELDECATDMWDAVYESAAWLKSHGFVSAAPPIA